MQDHMPPTATGEDKALTTAGRSVNLSEDFDGEGFATGILTLNTGILTVKVLSRRLVRFLPRVQQCNVLAAASAEAPGRN